MWPIILRKCSRQKSSNPAKIGAVVKYENEVHVRSLCQLFKLEDFFATSLGQPPRRALVGHGAP